SRVHPSLSLPSYSAIRHLHSFPTRRSSDLSSSTFPLPTSCATRLRVTLATGITTPISAAASRPKSKSFCSSTFVNVGVKSRFTRSEEHTSELQSRENLVCRLLLEKKNINKS